MKFRLVKGAISFFFFFFFSFHVYILYVNLLPQSDNSSTGASRSLDDRLGTKITDSPRSDRSQVSGSPDGESPKGFGHER